jgi:hypothetical protein
MNRRLLLLGLGVLGAAATGVAGWWALRRRSVPPSPGGAAADPNGPPFTVKDRLAEFAEAATARLRPHFERAGVAWPPAELVLVGLKQERELQLHAPDATGAMRWIRSYPVLAASGGPGPKLREGDLQAPEGLYGIELLNANSRYHVSLRVNYPNAFDRARAAETGRTNLGGDIMIHGRAVSIGCLAMGDPAAEEIFTLAARVGIGNIRVILAPADLRTRPAPEVAEAPPWLPDLYREVAAELQKLPAPGR